MLSKEDSNNLENDSENLPTLEHVLPSFQMHNYLLNRTIFDREGLETDQPPLYDDNSPTEPENYAINLDEIVDPTQNPNLLLLNNINKLPKIESKIKVGIVLTKEQPMVGKSYKRETPLRQYRPGELVTGYIVIESRSAEPIPFEMMLVSLEGEVTTPGGATEKCLLRHSFLKMYDLSAGFHSGRITLKMQGNPRCMEYDRYDKTQIGFTHLKQVLPGIKHKKFFTFKLPYELLDITCNDQFQEHLKLPPSYGFDYESFDGSASNVKVDPVLGYGRAEIYGSPIKVYDSAIRGQSVSYYIKVQMIGRKHLINQNNPLPDVTEFVNLHKAFHYFRVDTSKDTGEVDENLKQNELQLPVTKILSTKEQLKLLEKEISHSIEEILSKNHMVESGITDVRQQEEILNNAPKSKKQFQLSKQPLGPTFLVSNGKDNKDFSLEQTFQIHKNFFNRTDGEIKIKLSMEKKGTIASIKPKAFQTKNTTKINAEKIMNSEQDSLPSSSEESLKSGKSDSLKQTIQKHCFVSVDLIFRPNNNLSKTDLPSSIVISPSLKLIGVQSLSPIPVVFDEDFFFDDQLIQKTVPNIKRKYESYLRQLKDMVVNKNYLVPRTLFDRVNAMNKISVWKTSIEKLFISNTIDLQNKWEFDQLNKHYKCSFMIPLAIDTKKLDKGSTSIIPSFQNCYLSRFYLVGYTVTVKKTKINAKFEFPINVV